MPCPAIDKAKFNFRLFGDTYGYNCKTFEQNKDKFVDWDIFDKVLWQNFFLAVAVEMAEVAGLGTDNSLIHVETDEVNRIVESIIDDRRTNRPKEDDIDESSQTDNDGKLYMIPEIFKTSNNNLWSKQDSWEEIGVLNVPSKVFTTNACRFDSVLSMLVFLFSNHFDDDAKDEFEFNLPAFSIIQKLLQNEDITFPQFRYLSHSMMLCNDEKYTQGSLEEVYRRFRKLSGASAEDPSIMSLFAAPYFRGNAYCSQDLCTKKDKKKRSIFEF
jgi:hypothetical protein